MHHHFRIQRLGPKVSANPRVIAHARSRPRVEYERSFATKTIFTGFYPLSTANGRPGVLARGRISFGCLPAMTVVVSIGVAGLERAGTMPFPSFLSYLPIPPFPSSIQPRSQGCSVTRSLGGWDSLHHYW